MPSSKMFTSVVSFVWEMDAAPATYNREQGHGTVFRAHTLASGNFSESFFCLKDSRTGQRQYASTRRLTIKMTA